MEQASINSFSQAQRERLAYIDFCLFFLGSIRRSDVSDRFGIQSAAATRDLALYRQQAGDGLTLDPTTKQYIARPGFKPFYEHAADRTLATLALGFGVAATDRVSSLIPCETPHQLNNPAPEIIAAVTRAIYQKRVARIRYVSFTSGETEREIAPFALANNGLRWHVRAYDRLRNHFTDFVLTRILAAEDLHDSKAEEHERSIADIQWSRIVPLELVPHPKNAKHKSVIEMDYGMSSGVLNVNVRAALAGYFLRQWSVDSSRNAEMKDEEIRLWLRNHLALYGVDSAKFAPGFEPISN